jgi:hypothetical protein
MSEWLSIDDPRLSRVKQKREAILAQVAHTHLATVYWPGDKGPWLTTYDKLATERPGHALAGLDR